MPGDVVYLGKDKNARNMMADAKFFEAYSRWDETNNRYETWEEAVGRVMNMHRSFYENKTSPELEAYINEAEEAYKGKYVLGAQRALQFGGEQLLKHQMRLYNCTSTYADRVEFFEEYFYILLTGAGAGVSVQKHHVEKLPEIKERTKQSKIHHITDDIEGWATAAGVLMSSYFAGGGSHPEYEGRRIYFDTSDIRPKGAFISGGFKAPGPEPLRKALDQIEYLLQGLVLKNVKKLEPIHVYDISMFLADAVLAGGVRRSATIFLFSFDDEKMNKAKTGNWFVENPQRGRSNNSAVIIRNEITKEQFDEVMKNVKEFGEPGFVFFESKEHCTNPCVEIGMLPQIDGVSGWQGCNLTELNGSKATDKETFFYMCKVGSILGTLQAGYTDFKFLPETTRKIFEREALLGVSITGWMNNPQVLFDEETLKEGAKIVLETNKKVAKLLGINPAARTTCVKPSGNASVLLQTASGIHGEHSPKHIRNVQMNKGTEVAQLIAKTNPYMIEESVWSTNKTDYVISFPVITPKTSVYKENLFGVNLLEKVKLVQQTWVEYGTDESLCQDSTVRHNVSNTISVKEDQWEEVANYIFDNRNYFAGISLLSATGDKDYNQAPNTEILDEEELVKKYGRGAIFASGLVVDAFNGFDNLWDAIYISRQKDDPGTKEKADNRAEWVRRFRKFADNYFDGDQLKADHCLKAVYLLHKWNKIQQNFVNVDFVSELQEKAYTDIDTMGAIACQGGACEI